MSERAFLLDIAVVLAASFPALFLCKRLELPSIVGYLVTGVAIGPHALGLLRTAGRVEEIAELGVVLILFFVGLEFPFAKLQTLGRTALFGGVFQLSLTTLAVAALARTLGDPIGVAVFKGALLSLSSTAVLIPILASRDELAAPYARRFFAVSLFQDLAVIPFVLFLPMLAPKGAGAPSTARVFVGVGVALVGVALLVGASRVLVPRLLDAVARLGSRESFTGGVIVIVLVTLVLAEAAGVSAALGAFVAGIVIGESEHVHEVAATLAPFRDVLSSLFFVSIGMLLDPRSLLLYPVAVAVLVALVVLVKTLAAFASVWAVGAAPRTALRTAMALATVGEFSFVLAAAGRRLSLLSAADEQLLVAVAVVTLALAPLLVAVGPRLAPLLPERVESGIEEDPHGKAPLSGHVVVVGYGMNGRNVARTLKEIGVPCVVLEMESDRVDAARRDGVRALRADATGKEALLAAHVATALGVVVTIADPDATRRAVRLARRSGKNVRILVRTRYVSQVETLRALGADEVIPEEFETSIEIVARVLRLLHLPGNIVATQIRLLRDEGYRRLRESLGRETDGRRIAALVAAGTTELFLVLPDTPAEGATLSDLQLDAEHVAVPALLRDGKPFAPPPLDLPVQAGDTLLLVGAHEDLARAVAKLEEKRGAPA